MNTENHYQETDLGNISLNPRGEYNPEESYEYLDLVVLEGGSYVCLAENGATITGISPESGKTTQYWQVITIPGSLTPEYIAMHDRVVNLSEQVEADAEEVRTAEQNVSGMELNVTQMQEQTRQSAEAAEQSKDSSAGYAASADASRQAAEESKQNIDAQVTGFDSHVAEKTEEAENDIEAARIAANKAIIAQQEQSVNEVARAGIEAISTAQSAAQTATEKAQAADTSEKNAVASETAAKLSETNATKMAEQVAVDKEQVANDRTAVENAKQEMTGSVAQIEQNTQGISELKGDLEQLDDGLSSGEVHYIYDSTIGEIKNDGSETQSKTGYKSDFLECNKIEKILVSKEEWTAFVAFYDENKGFVKRISYNDGSEVNTNLYSYVKLYVYSSTNASEEMLRRTFKVVKKSAFTIYKQEINEIAKQIEHSKGFRKPFTFSKTINMVKGSNTLDPFSIDELKAVIDECIDMHIDTICASAMVSPSVEQKDAFENGSISADELIANICPSIDTINQLMAYASINGLKCSVLQIHSSWLRDEFKDGKLTFEEMRNIYYNGVSDLLDGLNEHFEYVGVYNEYNESDLANPSYRTSVLSTLNLVKRYTKVGLSGCPVIDHTLLNNVDVYLPHTYIQPFVYFGKYSDVEHAVNKVKNHTVWARISHARNYKPTLPVIASEFGTQSGWECLYNPGTYHTSDSFTLEENGEPQIFYLKAIMPFFKKYGISVASYWWTLYGSAKDYVKSYNDCEVIL